MYLFSSGIKPPGVPIAKRVIFFAGPSLPWLIGACKFIHIFINFRHKTFFFLIEKLFGFNLFGSFDV